MPAAGQLVSRADRRSEAGFAGRTPGKPVNNGGMLAMIDPRAAWKQMYRESWHLQRDFLYDPHTHGLDMAKIEAKYQPYLEDLASRDEFTYLCDEMLGEVQVGHMFVRGPRGADECAEAGTARRRLHHRSQPLPIREDLQRRRTGLRR